MQKDSFLKNVATIVIFEKKGIPHDRAKPLVRLARQGGGGQHLIPFHTLDAV